MGKLGLLLAAMFALQAVLSGIQMRHFSNEFIKLRRQGRVVCGRQAGGFHAGAIVMFLIDKDGTIRTAKKLMGVTCLARVKPLEGFDGKYVGGLTKEDLPKYGKNLRKAIMDASNTYNKFISGEEIPQPPTPFQKIGRTAAAFIGKS